MVRTQSPLHGCSRNVEALLSVIVEEEEEEEEQEESLSGRTGSEHSRNHAVIGAVSHVFPPAQTSAPSRRRSSHIVAAHATVPVQDVAPLRPRCRLIHPLSRELSEEKRRPEPTEHRADMYACVVAVVAPRKGSEHVCSRPRIVEAFFSRGARKAKKTRKPNVPCCLAD
ncbi:hypothetical protein HPB51_019223 [Rhipicephalus microplus]|uniref:Uncharacterized protein n=1 Tax=Rhipicephalus microplus TaxID=6941 RepID=A0A9J6DB27_RHIMP|nr:hypothetical protein HPB51_019223 [Rhipicephalus microplus]